MLLTTDIKNIKLNNRAVALGFFDGIHTGHRSVIETMTAQAEKAGLEKCVFTFTMEGSRPFAKKNATLLRSDRQKMEILEGLSVDEVVEPAFESFMELSPEEFFKDILIDTLGAKLIVTGSDYRFGKGAAGDTDLLEKLSREQGITYIKVAPVTEGGSIVSSTLIRGLIEKGELERANSCLGEDFTLCGVVSHGAKLGRTIGFPTINFSYPEKFTIPPYGVYLVRVKFDGFLGWGITNIGVKPTFKKGELSCETYIFDYEGDLYGKYVCISLKKLLRYEQTFGNIIELQSQIMRDKACGEAYIHKMEKKI